MEFKEEMKNLAIEACNTPIKKTILNAINDLPNDTNRAANSLISDLLVELRSLRIEYTIFINKTVGLSINEHVKNGNWVQLEQIREALSKDIERSMRNESEFIKDGILKSITLEEKFAALSRSEKERLIKSIEL